MTDPRMTPTNDAPVTVEQWRTGDDKPVVEQRHRDAAAWAMDRSPDSLTWENATASHVTPERKWQMNRVAEAMARMERDTIARHRLAALASAPAGKLNRDFTARRIKELMDEGDGFWTACSGCQESCDGYVSERDYPFDPMFRCQPGGGCSECGGIGVLWDDGHGYDDITGDEEPASAPAGDGVDMILHCPVCGVQHIDEPSEGWDNPPHRSHLCLSCGHIWRPADVPTNGVAAIKTKGSADAAPVASVTGEIAAAFRAGYEQACDDNGDRADPDDLEEEVRLYCASLARPRAAVGDDRGGQNLVCRL